LANDRWIDEVPDELKLNPIEEQLVARAHLSGKILHLHGKSGSFASIKGHFLLVGQDPSELLTLLPMVPEELPKVMKVVWVGSKPTNSQLEMCFTIRRDVVFQSFFMFENLF
jgi:hypothetical protein